MNVMVDLIRLKKIANDLRNQFDCPDLNPVLIQTIVPYEDYVFICDNKKNIYQLADSNEDCAILLTYIMVHLAFDEYDEEGFWNHFKNFIGVSKIDRKKAFDPIVEVLEMYGFRLYQNGGRQLVKSLLFNAGVPSIQANVFFDTLYNEFYKKYSGLISNKINLVIDKIERYYQDHDYSIIGFVTVREFLSDSTYSGELCRNVLKKMDQMVNNPDDILTIDLGLLEKPFDRWYRHDRLIRKKTENSKNGLMIDSGDYDIYYVIPSMDVDTVTYPITIEPELSEDHQDVIKTIHAPDGLKTIRSKLRLGDYPILDGVKIIHESETLFKLPVNKYLIFDKDGFLKKQLSPGNNTIIGSYELSEETDIPISQILAEKDNYCVYRTFELSTNDTFEIFGEIIAVGSNNENAKIDANRIKNKVKIDNKPVNALYSHPKIVFNPEFKDAIIDIYRNDRLIYSTPATGPPIIFDPISIPGLSIKNGKFKIKARFGSKVFNYEYVCINDFKVSFNDGSNLNNGSLTITANGETKSFNYGKTDINITCPMKIETGLYVKIEIKTPVLAFQYKPTEDIWCYPSLSSTISSSDITRNFIISCGFENHTLCSLQFISKGKKVIGDEYARSHDGVCRFRIHHINEIINFKDKIEVIYIEGSGDKHPIVTLNDTSKVEIDNYLGGLCIFTLTNKNHDCHVLLKAQIDGKIKTIPLESNTPEVFSYLYNLNYEIIEETDCDKRLITNGNLSTSESLLIRDDLSDNEKLTASANDGNVIAQFVLAKRLIEKHKFKKGYPYLMEACKKGYEPAYLEMVYYHLFFNNDCKEYAPYFNKLKYSKTKSISLFYEIEKIAHPALNYLEEVCDRPQ